MTERTALISALSDAGFARQNPGALPAMSFDLARFETFVKPDPQEGWPDHRHVVVIETATGEVDFWTLASTDGDPDNPQPYCCGGTIAGANVSDSDVYAMILAEI